MNKGQVDGIFSKVPEVTLWFWIIKVFATTLGETGGDAVTMNLGYLTGSVIFVTLFVIAVAAQIHARRFHLCAGPTSALRWCEGRDGDPATW